jgi:serine/threonine-protein kinase
MSTAPDSGADPHDPTPTPPPLPAPRSRRAADPERIGRFRIDGELGRGGMGVVYQGHDPDLGRDVAVKVLHAGLCDDPSLGRRFLDEARLSGQLEHPGVVPVHEVGRLPDGRLFFAMKRVRGRTLAGLLRERPDPAHDLPRFLLIFEQVCQAVGYAHSRGVLHRDLKPSNVMVGAFGEVQVMDWGLAKVLASRGRQPPEEAPSSPGATPAPRTGGAGATVAGMVLGTPAYMAPEQARGEVDALDARSDVFSLGAVLCEILTGWPPYRGGPQEERTPAATAGLADVFARLDALEELKRAATADLADAFARLDACRADAELVRLAKACLEERPSERPGDAGAAAEAVAAYRAGVQERLRAAELAKAAAQLKAAEERKRRRLAWALAALVLLAAAAGGAAVWWVGAERAKGERAAEAAVQEAGLLAGQQKWAEARAALDRADELLAGAAEAVRGRARRMRNDVKLAESLEDIRQEEATGRAGFYDDSRADKRYAEAFAGYGIDVEALGPDEAAARIGKQAIREQLTAALDDWAARRKTPAGRAPLLAAARRADPDEWRDRVRTALEAGGHDELAAAADAASADLPPATQVFLGQALTRAGLAGKAAALLRQAQRRHPADYWVNAGLAKALLVKEPWEPAEAVRFASAAVALRPDSPFARVLLGAALSFSDRHEEAVAAFDEAIRLRPDWAAAHYDRGSALKRAGRPAEALAAFRQAARLDADDPEARYQAGLVLALGGDPAAAIPYFQEAVKLNNGHPTAFLDLGIALERVGRGDEAVAAYREAVRVRPDSAKAHCALGVALRKSGRFAEALEELRLGDKLGAVTPGWPYRSAEWVSETERLLQYDLLLSTVLRGEAEPADAGERAGFARFCQQYKRRYAAAARLWEGAFADRPELKDDLAAGSRYDAACAAALAGCGRGDDAAALSDAERARWRRQALAWLREDLAVWRKLLASPNAAGRAAAQKALRHWREDADLADLRDAAGLAQLPDAEKAEWKKLWNGVDDALGDPAGPG